MNASPSESDPRRQMNLERNIESLIASAGRLPKGAAESLMEPVLVEVRRQHRRLARRRAVAAALISITAAAAVILGAVYLQPNALEKPTSPVRPGLTQPEIASAATEVARIRAVSGLASLTNGASARALAGRESVTAGQWLRTAWGSRAEVLLADQSQLVLQAHTRLQINARPSGREILLDEGQISFEVAKQPVDKTVTVRTPQAQVTVVGTTLDVQVITKSDGRKQTWVDVHSGRVELTSGAKRVVLLPNMQGIATGDEPPVARSQTSEVNELARLVDQTAALAARGGIQPGGAAIIEFSSDGSATLWSLIETANAGGTALDEGRLECDAIDGDLDVFSLDGARFPVVREREQWRVDWSADPLPPGQHRTLVVRVCNVGGLFAPLGGGVFEFSGPASRPAELSLLQLRLPSSAHVEEIMPEPIEVRRSLSRFVLTLSSVCELPRVVRQVPPQ